MMSEDPDEETLNYIFLKQHYHLNGHEEIPIFYFTKSIVNSFYGDDDVNRRSLKAAMFVLDKGKPVKQVMKDLSTMDWIVEDKLPVDSTRCDSCTRRNTRRKNTEVLECSLCSRTCCVDCRLQHLVRDETGCAECSILAGSYGEEHYSSDDEYLPESEREAKRRRIQARFDIWARRDINELTFDLIFGLDVI